MFDETGLLGDAEIALETLEHFLGRLPVPALYFTVVALVMFPVHVLHHVVHEGGLEEASLETALQDLDVVVIVVVGVALALRFERVVCEDFSFFVFLFRFTIFGGSLLYLLWSCIGVTCR